MIPFKKEKQNINGLYKKEKNVDGWNYWSQLDSVCFCPSLQHVWTEFLFMCIGATLLFSGIYSFADTCFCVFNIYKMQPDRKFGNVFNFF